MVIQNFLPTNLTDYITDDALFFHTRFMELDGLCHGTLRWSSRTNAVCKYTQPPLSFPLGSFVLTFLLLCVSIMLYAYERIILADRPTDQPT